MAKIVVTCATSGPPYHWADLDCQPNNGGSEEYLIYVCRELVAMGHKVVISNNCGELAGTYHGVKYVPYTDPLPPGDVLVSQRNWTLLLNQPDYRMRLESCHDDPVSEALHGPAPHDVGLALRHIDYFLLLNNYHRKSWGIIPTDRICLTGVGIDHSLFENVDIVREPGKCIYFSHPGKGLGRLRQVWPQIKQAVPHATLHAFWNWEQFWLPSDLELGIMPMKWLSPADIAKEILSSSVLAYPSVYRELFPMTCMKAQRGGAVPVVVCEGGMDEVIQWGVKCNHNDFAAQVIAMLLDEPRQQSIREPMMEWAKQFTWRAVAGRWAALWET